MKQFYTKTSIIIAALAICTSAATARTTSTSSRLLAQSHYNGTAGVLTAYDSQRYVYPNATAVKYTQEFSYMNGTAGWGVTTKSDFTYNTAGNLTNMQFQNWSTATSAYINGGLTFYTLNSAGYCVKDSNLIWLPATSAYRNNVRNTYTVNSTGQITDQVYEYWDAGSSHLLNTYHHVNSYNTAGNPLVQLTQEWDASIHWMDHFRDTYAYDASGTKLHTITGEQDNLSMPGVLQTTYQNVYTLNTDGTVASVLSNLWNISSSSYKPSMRSTETYDATGNNTTQTDEQWDVTTSAYKPYQQYVRTFNSHHQMTSETRMMWNGTAYATASSRDNYYYEDYTVPTGVSNTEAEDAFLSLAPMPTTGELHIALKWSEPQAFTAVITDMNGRQCYTFSDAANKEYNNNIGLGNLPAGNYVLTIKGELGSIISRMIVLQH